MTWEVEYTDPFGEWCSQLNEEGNALWYDKTVPLADRLYDEHLRNLETEDSPNG